MKYIFLALFLATVLGASAQTTSTRYVKGVVVGSDTVYRPITPSKKELKILENQPTNTFHNGTRNTKELIKGQTVLREEYIPCDCPSGHSTDDGPCNPLDSIAMVKVYRADFSYLVAGLNNAALINQLVVQVDKPSLSFTYVYLDKSKRRVISPGFNLRVGTTDDLATLLSDGKWNTTMILGARFNIDLFKAITPQYERYYYLTEERDRVLCRVQVANFNLDQRKKKITNRKTVLDDWINDPTSIPDTVHKGLPRGIVRTRLVIERDSIILLMRADSLEKYRRKVLDDIQLSMKWNGKEHLWLSFNPDFSPRVVNLFDANDLKSQQVPERRFLTTTIPITLNYYRALGEKQRPSLYTASIAFERTNDIMNEDYRQQFEKEITSYTAILGGTAYANKEKKTFYTGNDRMIWNKRLGAQAIWFFNKEQWFGLIANATYIVPDNQATMNRPYTNLSLGAIVPAITADGKSKLNVVVTGVLTDAFANIEAWKKQRDDTYETSTIWKRLALTVKVGLPLNFLNNN